MSNHNLNRRSGLSAVARHDRGARRWLLGFGLPAHHDSGGEGQPRRLPVYQSDRLVGTLPADVDPSKGSCNILYDPRGGDFRRGDDHWIADRTLGPGDLEAVPGFSRTVVDGGRAATPSSAERDPTTAQR